MTIYDETHHNALQAAFDLAMNNAKKDIFPSTVDTTVNASLLSRMSSGEQKKGDSADRQWESEQWFLKAMGWPYKPELHLRQVGSAFRGGQFKKGTGLGDLDYMIDHNILPANSKLIIECNSRLNRQIMGKAVPHFWKMVNAGIDIYVLIDQKVYTKGDDNSHGIRSYVDGCFNTDHQASVFKKLCTDRHVSRIVRSLEAKEPCQVPWLPVWITFKPKQ